VTFLLVLGIALLAGGILLVVKVDFSPPLHLIAGWWAITTGASILYMVFEPWVACDPKPKPPGATERPENGGG
jgi:hypothetical protein